MGKFVDNTSNPNFYSDHKPILQFFFIIDGLNLFMMSNNISFNILKFWTHHWSSYLVNRNMKNQVVLHNLTQEPRFDPSANKVLDNCKLCKVKVMMKNYTVLSSMRSNAKISICSHHAKELQWRLQLSPLWPFNLHYPWWFLLMTKLVTQ
jgi:hypothetical protein